MPESVEVQEFLVKRPYFSEYKVLGMENLVLKIGDMALAANTVMLQITAWFV